MTRKQLQSESGQSMIEYALLVGLLVFAVLSGVSMLGSSVDGVFSQLQTSIGDVALAAVSFPSETGQSNDAATPGDQSNGRGNPNAPGLSIAPGLNDTAGQPETPGQSGAPGQSIAPGNGNGNGNPERPEGPRG